ncbi:MAG: hypothetical protein ACK4NM_18720, partial [Hydrogenophaga sp.]
PRALAHVQLEALAVLRHFRPLAAAAAAQPVAWDGLDAGVTGAQLADRLLVAEPQNAMPLADYVRLPHVQQLRRQHGPLHTAPR